MPKQSNDIKSLALKHAEKAVLGVVALLVALAIFSMKGPYKGEPEAITQKVQKAEKDLQVAVWPVSQEMDKQFLLAEEENPEKVAQQALSAAVRGSQYEWETPFYIPLYKQDQAVQEPKFLPIRELTAVASTVIIPVEPEGDAVDDAETEEVVEETAEDDPLNPLNPLGSDIPEELQSRPDAPVAMEAGDEGYGDYGDDYYDGGYEDPYGPNYQPDVYVDNSDDDGYGGAYGEDYDPYAIDGGAGGGGGGGLSYGTTGALFAPNENAQGEGHQYVAVRGVFPKRDQVRLIASALNITQAEANDNLELIDFELQRKVMDRDQTADDVEWEDVDMRYSMEVLEKALDTEPPVLMNTLLDPVITMDLPQRVRGIYGSKATHPAIENFKLSDEDREMQRKLILKFKEEQERNAPAVKQEPDVVKKGGFQRAKTSLVDMEAGLSSRTGNNSRFGNNSNPLLDLFEGEEEGFEERMAEFLKKKNSVSGELLLFRYLDFDVDPQMKYQYRVRLVIKNPNYGKTPGEAGGVTFVVEGQTRTTEWSEPSDIAVTSSTSDYFVGNVIRGRTDADPLDARLSIYKWDPEYGTIIRGDLPLYPGKKIEGTKVTPVLDPAKHLYSEKEYEFETDDWLVAAIPDETLDTRYHDDIELPKGSRRRLGLPQAMLIGSSKGHLLSTNQASSAPQRALKDKLVELERRDYVNALRKLNEPKPATRRGGEDDGGAYGPGYDPF